MKAIIGLMVALGLSHNVYAAENGAMSKFSQELTALIDKVCLSPASAGKLWKVSVAADVNAKVPVRVVMVNGGAKAVFEKGEWEGVQQVLPKDRPADNESFRACSAKLTPLFLARFSPPGTVKKSSPPKSLAPSQLQQTPEPGSFSNKIEDVSNSKVIQINAVSGPVTIN